MLPSKLLLQKQYYISPLISIESGTSRTLAIGSRDGRFSSVKGSSSPEYKLLMIQLKGCNGNQVRFTCIYAYKYKNIRV